MRFKIVDKAKYELLEKIAKRTDNYISQIKIVNASLKIQKDKMNHLEDMVYEIANAFKEKEDARRKTASKVGGLQSSLNRQKEKNKLLLKLSKSLEKQLDDKTKESEKTEKELEEIKRQLEFFKNHRKAYSMEEYRNYVERRKECEKRLKENNEGRTIKQ